MLGAAGMVAAGLVAPPPASAVSVTSATSVTSASSAPATAVPAAPAPSAAPAAKRTPWRWSQYVAQRPVWRASSCSPATRNPATVVAEVSPGSKVLCAQVRTPLDWRDLTKGSATLQLTRVTRRVVKGDRRATRVLFVNPGGPGVAADWLAPTTVALEPAIGRSHDVVAMDPRGTGRSMPVACPEPDDGVRDRRNPTTASIRAQQRALAAWVRSCVKAKGAALSVVSTQQTIRDQDFSRRLMRANTIDYYGVSAGTWLGARYAELYPGRVGRFVLDSNTEFSSPWRASFAWQPLGFQRRFDAQFLPWLARQHATWGMGRTTAQTRAAFTDLRAAVSRGRIRGLTPDDLDDMVAEAMYTDATFIDLADKLADLRSRVGGSAARRAAAISPAESAAEAALGADDSAGENTVFTAVTCNDSPWSRSAASYVAEGMRLGRLYPLIGYQWVTSACAYWPYAPQVAPRPVKRVPMVMVQTELDPATPIEGARRAHAATPGTRLISVDDQGNHGAFLGENPCVEKAVNAYLTAGTLPPVDSVCAGMPLPNEKRVYPVGSVLKGVSPNPGRRPAAARSGDGERLAEYAQRRIADAAQVAD